MIYHNYIYFNKNLILRCPSYRALGILKKDILSFIEKNNMQLNSELLDFIESLDIATCPFGKTNPYAKTRILTACNENEESYDEITLLLNHFNNNEFQIIETTVHLGPPPVVIKSSSGKYMGFLHFPNYKKNIYNFVKLVELATNKGLHDLSYESEIEITYNKMPKEPISPHYLKNEVIIFRDQTKKSLYTFSNTGFRSFIYKIKKLLNYI